MERKIDRVI